MNYQTKTASAALTQLALPDTRDGEGGPTGGQGPTQR